MPADTVKLSFFLEAIPNLKKVISLARLKILSVHTQIDMVAKYCLDINRKGLHCWSRCRRNVTGRLKPDEGSLFMRRAPLAIGR